MKLVVLLSVVAVQVLLFQWGCIAFTRSLFALHFGDATAHPAEVARRYVSGVARLQGLLGLAFVAALLLVGFGFPAGDMAGPLTVAVVSVASSLAFAATMIRSRKTLRVLQEALPDAGVRRAALVTRTRAHSPLFESLPLVALGITTGFVVWALAWGLESSVHRLGPYATRMLVYLSLQGIVTVVLMWASIRLRQSRTAVSARFPRFRDHPESALQLGIDLADAESHAFGLAKLGIAAWFAFNQLQLYFDATSNTLHRAAGIAEWACIAFLLLVYGLYLLRVRNVVRTGNATP